MKMSKIIIAAHQPNFMPYLGFFHKMQEADIFVIRDDVLFVKKEFHNRNKIRINGNNKNNPQSKWLNVPVINPHDYILYAKIKKDLKYKNKILWNSRVLHNIKTNYDKAPFFERFFPELERIFDNSDDTLISLNMKLIRFLARVLNIKTKIIMASHLKLKPLHYENSNASQDLVNICKALGADIYLSGSGGKGYLDESPFLKEGIKLQFQEYVHPTYKQNYPGFLFNMTAIDALFCFGEMPSFQPQLLTKIKSTIQYVK